MDQVRIGMIGVSGRGRNLASHWHRPGGKSIVAAGADVYLKKLEDFKDRVNKDAFLTTDYKELLERKDIDAVAVASPDQFHEEQAIAALEAGKHVFCEKPLAITVEGCDRILKAWKQSGKKLMIGFNMPYTRMFRTVKGIVDSGVIGQIKAVWVRHFVGKGSLYYYHDWHAVARNTTSLLLQKGSHDIDLIHWITGSYSKKVTAFGSLDFFGGDKPDDLTCPKCPEKETCTEAVLDDHNGRYMCAFRKEVDVEDNNVMIMELDNKIKATYTECHFTPDYHRNFVFIGTEGSVENSQPDNKIWVKTRKSNTWCELSDRTYDIKESEGGHWGADPDLCKDFIDMILYNKKPPTNPLAARMSVAAGCAAAESMRAGGKVLEIPPLTLI